MFALNSDLRKLKDITNKLQKEISIPIGNVSFDYLEQDLIRMVFKSVFAQIKSREDKKTAKNILSKTEWIDGENK